MGATDQRSQFHTTGVAGTDGEQRPTAANLRSERYQQFGDGVIPFLSTNINGQLAATSPAVDQISIARGAAWIYGEYFEVPTSTTLNVARPSATTGGHVVLRFSMTAQTTPIAGTTVDPASTPAASVRLVAVRSDSGNTAIPALARTAGAVWEMRLASFQVTAAGVITLTDVRPWARPRSVLERRQGGSSTNWNTGGTTNHNAASNMMQAGSVFVDEVGAVAAPSGNIKTIPITFPVAYAQPPIVIVSGAAPGSQSAEAWTVGANDVTTTGFNLRVIMASLDANSANIGWLAIGPDQA